MQDIKKNRVVWMHLSFWCVYISFLFYRLTAVRPGSPEELDWNRVLSIIFIQISFAAFLGYLNYFYFLPRFLREKKSWRYLIQFAVIFAVLIYLRINLERYLIFTNTGREVPFMTRFYVQVYMNNFFIVVFLAMLRFAVEWFELESNKKSIENERLTAELNFLKAQINPHFLFNTLNNLYYLAYSKSPNTPEVIAKLSQMMRYMIYDSNYTQVPLSKEIEYMENYISLERLRLNDAIPINFDVKGDVSAYVITPLIFITFLENAFKHGVSNNNPKAFVNVAISLDGKQCTYIVENSRISTAKPESEEKSGIGLQNLKRRLELSYPERHKLIVNDLPDRYRVTLKIMLS